MDETLVEDSLQSFVGSFDLSLLESFLKTFLIFAIIILVLGLIFYIMVGIFLNKFNRLITGKGTPLAFIPICNIYLLGKLTVSKLVGWLLVIGLFLSGSITTTINGVSTTKSILPGMLGTIYSKVYGIIILILFIYALYQFIVLKRSEKIASEEESKRVGDSTTAVYNNGQFIQPNNQNINNSNLQQ